MTTEYRITRLDDKSFKLAKFGDESGDQPENLYFVSWDKAKDEMLCNCPNRRRGKHVDDKHGNMVRDWLARGEPIGFYDKEGDFHGQQHLTDDPFATYDDFPDDEAPPNGNLDGDDEDEHR